MGGDIVASSTPGIGSVFTFSFIADAIQGSAASAETRAELGRSVRLRGAHVLLTDDNAINRQVARLFLQPQGAIITEACNGQEALDALAAGEFDLLLLDVHMPVMDGKQTIQRIRSSGAAWNRLPVLALTADAMSGDRERLLALGMSGYVSKPIDQSELLAEIGRVLGGGGIIAPLTDAPKASVAAEAFDDLLGDLDKIVNG
jgi:hypothetical protein